MTQVNIEMSLEELKLYKKEYEQVSQSSLENMKNLNDILMKKLELGPTFPHVSEKTKKLQELLVKLSALISEKQELTKAIETKHESLKSLYFEQKKALEESELVQEEHKSENISANTLSDKEILEIQAERDKALGLAKILLATLKSSRMQSEENFHKLKYSADLMFHILYKAEDAFLGGPDETTE